MSGPQPEHEQDAQSRDQIPHRAGSTQPEYRPSSALASDRILETLKGHGDPEEVPQLVSMLDAKGKEAIEKDFERFKTLPGRIVLRAAANMSVAPNVALRVALHAKTPVSRIDVRRYLEEAQAPHAVANLEPQIVDALKGLGGSPLDLLGTLQGVGGNRSILRWAIAAMPAPLCAHAIGSALDSDMVKALDADDLWGSWIDDLRPTDIGVFATRSIPEIANARAKAAFSKAASGRAGMSMDENQMKAAGEQPMQANNAPVKAGATSGANKT